MKPKIICLLAVLFCCGLAASPNRCTSNGINCAGKHKANVTASPAKPAVMMIEDIELLPIQHYPGNF